MSHGAREPGEIGAAVLTISTSRARGEGGDESGPALAEFAESVGATVIGTEVIPDERELIEGRLRWWCDDVTPEATRAVIEREAPGIGEAMRAASRDHTPMWMASRAIAGTRGRSLIVNFPGNPPAIEQAGAAIAEALPHMLGLLARR